jgi:uncharacterized protein
MAKPGAHKGQKQMRFDTVQRGECTIGVISDTHGLIRPEALEALKGSELIIHAGDVGRQEVLDALGKIAPVFAVRGNNDRGKWADKLPITTIVDVGTIRIGVVHILRDFGMDPEEENISAIISGHSHRASTREKNGVLYLNPGTAGPRRFGQPATVAKILVRGEELDTELITL